MKKLLLITLFLLSGAITAQDIFKKEDKFAEETHFFTRQREANLEGGSFLTRRYVYFKFHVIQKKGENNIDYAYISIEANLPSWMFIEPGESLVLKTESGEFIKLKGRGSIESRRVLGPEKINEIATYLVGKNEFSRIANSQKIEFRILGSNQTITGEWGENTMSDARAMSAEFFNNTAFSSQEKRLQKKRLGIQFYTLEEKIVKALDLAINEGVIVLNVENNSLAQKAGIMQGDIVTGFNDNKVSKHEDLLEMIQNTPANTLFQIKIWRAGQNLTFEFKL